MTSLGRLIFFDQPGTGASDPVTAGALPTLEQWADSITAVLDDLGSSEAVLLAVGIGFAPAALFAATHPSRTTALVVLGGYADAGGTLMVQDEPQAAMVRMWGSGKIQRLMNPDMPWNPHCARCVHDPGRQFQKHTLSCCYTGARYWD